MKAIFEVGDLVKLEGEFWKVNQVPATKWIDRFFYMNRMFYLSALIDGRELIASERYMMRMVRENVVHNHQVQ